MMNPLFSHLLILFSKNSYKPPVRLEKEKKKGLWIGIMKLSLKSFL